MPHEVLDENSGAILYRKTDQEKQFDRIEEKIETTEAKIDYIFRAMKRYEPVFEDMLKNLNKR